MQTNCRFLWCNTLTRCCSVKLWRAKKGCLRVAPFHSISTVSMSWKNYPNNSKVPWLLSQQFRVIKICFAKYKVIFQVDEYKWLPDYSMAPSQQRAASASAHTGPTSSSSMLTLVLPTSNHHEDKGVGAHAQWASPTGLMGSGHFTPLVSPLSLTTEIRGPCWRGSFWSALAGSVELPAVLPCRSLTDISPVSFISWLIPAKFLITQGASDAFPPVSF